MRFYRYLIILLIIEVIFGQLNFKADPFYLLSYEKEFASRISNYNSMIFRPINNQFFPEKIFFINARSEFYYNTNSPNLENTSDKWIGKGAGFFSSLSFDYRTKFYGFSVEPYYFITANADYDEPNRKDKFSVLNDARPHTDSPYASYGLRESRFYINYKEFGIGWSNASMWWGSGMHTSSSMTNNTSGFGYVYLGTIEEKRIKKWGLTGQYIISKQGSKSQYNPYFVALLLGATYYSEAIISVGFVREALLGGDHPDTQSDNINFNDALTSIFKGILIPDDRDQYREDWSFDDHAGTFISSAYFPKSKLKIFFEIGRTDLASNLWSILVYPDHAIATNIGLRKYGLLGNNNIFFGIEYFQNRNSRSSHRIWAGDWYQRKQYEYSTYNGRRWAAHSGSDSDDFYITFGWLNEKFTILPSINYERHGLTQPTSDSGNHVNNIAGLLPETKIEFRLDLRYNYKKYKINLFYEFEHLLNLESQEKTRNGNVLWFGIEREIENDLLQSIFRRT